jgi:hypothetical protein
MNRIPIKNAHFVILRAPIGKNQNSLRRYHKNVAELGHRVIVRKLPHAPKWIGNNKSVSAISSDSLGRNAHPVTLAG